MNTRIETWAGHQIRFVEKESIEWWAVAVGVTRALDISNATMALKRICMDDKALISIEGISKGNDLVNILSEFGIYDLNIKEGKTVKVKDLLKKYRMSSNAEVILEDVKSGNMSRLSRLEIQNLEPEFMMNMKVNTFDVVDNEMTIYAE